MKPLAALLGAAARDAVFLDVNSIKPGDLWKQEIDSALQDAAVFILCWCCESQASDFVGYEIRMAIENRAKRVVPVRLCSSPLPNLLSDRQWIDLRGRIVHDCRDHIHMEKKANDPLSWLRMFSPLRLKNRVLEESRAFGGFDIGGALGPQSWH